MIATPVDEARTPEGARQPPYDALLAGLADDPEALRARATAVLERVRVQAVTHGAGDDRHPFVVDAVPRVFAAAEWDALAAGLVQRVRALEAFVADVHDEQRTLRDGVVPADLLDGCPWFEHDVREAPAPATWIGLAGPDVVRDEAGQLLVLEDNVRTPTLPLYAVAARRAVDPELPLAARDYEAELVRALHAMVRAARPDLEAPRAVVLGDGAVNACEWEVHALAVALGVASVEAADLRVDGDRLVTRSDGRAVDVVVRRTAEERLERDDGSPSELGELLLAPLRRGSLAVANAFGTGVADDKRTFCHVEALIETLLGEAPLLRSVPALDLGDARQRAEALERLDELVLKPRTGSGGFGVVLGPRASRTELAELREAINREPARWIAQRPVALSTHPTVVDGELRPRHVDLRPFVVRTGPDAWCVPPGGLSRYPRDEGDLVVNASQGGGGKATLVVD